MFLVIVKVFVEIAVVQVKLVDPLQVYRLAIIEPAS